ncbi:extracellular solute-binding protein [Lachnoclostridium sp. Marseille-P6806]|uniref:extracellular solute-binding protein n=1 Tax=Lachnoclostridium sp. Marseille-P6806 TaxID=2364793 RepID=UPI0013EF2D7E|nr:extracellular solute-binding protein [Lachnoclostridium sp. Marseille-P6806]
MKNRKGLALVTASALFATVFSGCGSTSPAAEVPAGEAPASEAEKSALADAKTSIKTVTMGNSQIEVEVTDPGFSGSFTYWSAFTGDSADWDQTRVDAFNEAYRDLGISCEVQYVPDGAGINNGKLLSAIAGGTAPDLLVTDSPVSAYQYAAEGSFMPLDEKLKAIGLDTSSFFAGCRDVMYYNDKIYLVPQDTNVIMLYYNPEIVRECGMDPEKPPKNLEELNVWADAMTIQTADGSYTRFGLIPWLDSGNDAFTLPYLFGANPYEKETNRINLTSDAMIIYMKWIRDFAAKYDAERINAFSSGLGGMFSPDHPFMTGKVAMTITGNWFSEALRRYAPDVPYEVCPVPVPEGGRAESTTFGCNVFAIPQGTSPEKSELAALFIKFCEQGSVNEDNFAQWRSIPVIDAAFDDVSLTKNGDEMYALERRIANSPENGIPALCSVSAELASQFQTVRDNVVYQGADPQTVLKELEDNMQRTMETK